jgi:hypothetical protein
LLVATKSYDVTIGVMELPDRAGRLAEGLRADRGVERAVILSLTFVPGVAQAQQNNEEV